MTKYSLVAFAFLYSSVVLAEDCELSVSIPSTSGTYSSSNLNERVPQTIVLTKLNNAACSGRIGFSTGQSGIYPRELSLDSDNLTYSLYKTPISGLDLRDVVDATSEDEVISFSFPEGINLIQNINFYYKINDNQQQFFLKKSGTYSDSINVRFYPINGLISYKTVSASFSAVVDPLYQIKVGSPGIGYDSAITSHSLTFDKNNHYRDASVYVKANNSYSVSFSSLNLGRLVHVANPTAFINYSLFFNNLIMNLQTGDSVHYQDNTLSIGEEKIMNFYCPIDPPSQLTGTYTDTITITIGPIN